jgi:hypothetical protein
MSFSVFYFPLQEEKPFKAVFMFSIAKAAVVSNFMAEIEGRTIKAEVWKNSAIQVLNLR